MYTSAITTSRTYRPTRLPREPPRLLLRRRGRGGGGLTGGVATAASRRAESVMLHSLRLIGADAAARDGTVAQRPALEEREHDDDHEQHEGDGCPVAPLLILERGLVRQVGGSQRGLSRAALGP